MVASRNLTRPLSKNVLNSFFCVSQGNLKASSGARTHRKAEEPRKEELHRNPSFLTKEEKRGEEKKREKKTGMAPLNTNGEGGGGGSSSPNSNASATPDGWDTSMPVIIAANRLPVRVTRREIPRSKIVRAANIDDGDGDATDTNGDSDALTVQVEWEVEWAGDRVIEAQNTFSHHEISQRANIKFVGRISEFAIPLDEQRELAHKLQEFNCYPVFVAEQEAKLYYEDYCKQTLWPTFHNVVDVYSPVDVVLDENDESFEEQAADEEGNKKKNEKTETSVPVWNPNSQKLAWQAYANVNQLFAQKICELYEPGDIVWVQDYHLLLTPSYIIRKVRGANIGLFLHVPFPSSEVFRTLSARKEILRGMLNADHIGFHLFERVACCHSSESVP